MRNTTHGLYRGGLYRVRHCPHNHMIAMKQITLVFAAATLLLAACASHPTPAPQAEKSLAPAASKPVDPIPAKPKSEEDAKLKAKADLPRQQDKQKKSKTVLGWVERATLAGSSHTVKAKLDSGAKTSSVDAEIVKTFKREGKKYVLYRVLLDDNISETYESRIIRWVRIKTKNGGYIRRPVVKMQFCIGKKKISGEVNLAERGHFIYPVLVGRNMLERGEILVDTSRTFLDEPECKQ